MIIVDFSVFPHDFWWKCTCTTLEDCSLLIYLRWPVQKIDVEIDCLFVRWTANKIEGFG